MHKNIIFQVIYKNTNSADPLRSLSLSLSRALWNLRELDRSRSISGSFQMGSCMSCSETAAKEPAGASSSRTRSGSQSWKTRKEGAKGEGGGGGGRWPAAVSVFGDVREDELHRLPDRLFLNGATEAACLYTQQGKKGTNQDAMVVWEVPGFNLMHAVKNFSPPPFCSWFVGFDGKSLDSCG